MNFDKNIEVLYKGNRLYYEEIRDSQSGELVRKFNKSSYAVHFRYLISIEQSYNVFTECKYSCLITLTTGEKLHVEGIWKELFSLWEIYIKNEI